MTVLENGQVVSNINDVYTMMAPGVAEYVAAEYEKALEDADRAETAYDDLSLEWDMAQDAARALLCDIREQAEELLVMMQNKRLNREDIIEWLNNIYTLVNNEL